MTDVELLDVFKKQYPSTKSAKVILDTVSGRTKGYGFVRFGSEEERDRAMKVERQRKRRKKGREKKKQKKLTQLFSL